MTHTIRPTDFLPRSARAARAALVLAACAALAVATPAGLKRITLGEVAVAGGKVALWTGHGHGKDAPKPRR
ncbi:hypothetical protein QZN04_36770, partial [Burkholderia gladioli]|nr:hypothetical protein [Burkholderia gladioli]